MNIENPDTNNTVNIENKDSQGAEGVAAAGNAVVIPVRDFSGESSAYNNGAAESVQNIVVTAPVKSDGDTMQADNNGGIISQDATSDKIHIADEVITQIIAIATGRITGVSIQSSGVGDGIAGFLGMKGSSRGIRIDTDDNGVGVDIYISVEYGLKMNEIAKALQDGIRGDLIDMTGLNVTHVNVHVISVNIKDPPSAKSQKTVKQQKEPGAEEFDVPQKQQPNPTPLAAAATAQVAAQTPVAVTPAAAVSAAQARSAVTAAASAAAIATPAAAPPEQDPTQI